MSLTLLNPKLIKKIIDPSGLMADLKKENNTYGGI
jgi:hypothetical protein